MPMPPGRTVPHGGTDLDDEIGVIYHDPASPSGVTGYYVILSLTPKRILRVDIPSESVSEESWRVLERLRDAVMPEAATATRPYLRLIG